MKTASKKIIIFGGASAISQATARLWAKQNARLTLIDRDSAKLDIVAADLTTRGASDVKTIATDLSPLDVHQDLIANIIKDAPPDIVLFSYGTLGNQSAGQTDFTIAHQELTTNFLSVVSLLTHLVNKIQPANHPTTIAVVSSVAGDRGRASNYIYGTAKGALTIWLAGLRHRLAQEGSPLHILTIKPGFVDTPMTKDFAKGLLWSQPEKIAKDINAAITNKKTTIYTPWFWRYIMLIIKFLPTPIFHKLKL